MLFSLYIIVSFVIRKLILVLPLCPIPSPVENDLEALWSDWMFLSRKCNWCLSGSNVAILLPVVLVTLVWCL